MKVKILSSIFESEEQLDEWCELQSLNGSDVSVSIKGGVVYALLEKENKAETVMAKIQTPLDDGKTEEEKNKKIKATTVADETGLQDIEVNIIGSHYIYNHGKKPAGKGKWAFGVNSRDQKDLLFFDGVYSQVSKEAIQAARKKAKKEGKSSVKLYVMESEHVVNDVSIRVVTENKRVTGELFINAEKICSLSGINESAISNKLQNLAESKQLECQGERSLSKKEEKKKETVVKGIKKSAKEMKARYGNDWQSVAYGAATNIAKKKKLSEADDGRDFSGFFSNLSAGAKGKPSRESDEELDVSAEKEFQGKYKAHRGNFDSHISASIPSFREVQVKVGNAIVRTFKEGSMLDIGGSEGALAKAIAESSGGRIRTTVVDPNFQMAQHFAKTPVKGAEYDTSAFGYEDQEDSEAWVEGPKLKDRDGQEIDNPAAGKTVKYFKPKEKYDAIHEAMVFQFISGDRDRQVARVKQLLSQDGIAIFEQKFVEGEGLSKDEWDANEKKKDDWKNQYFTKDEIEAKRKAVLQGTQKPDSDEKVVGMNDRMVSPGAFEKTLLNNFNHVVQYWDAGNFKGYVASDNNSILTAFVRNLGNMNNKFSTTKTPRVVTVQTVNEEVQTFEIEYDYVGQDSKGTAVTKYKAMNAGEARARFQKDNQGKRINIRAVRPVQNQMQEAFNPNIAMDVHDLTKVIMKEAVKFAKEQVEERKGQFDDPDRDFNEQEALEDAVYDYIEVLQHHLQDNRSELTSFEAITRYINEDYEEDQYGSTKSEVIDNIISKYFDGNDSEEIRTALSDAFSAGADIGSEEESEEDGDEDEDEDEKEIMKESAPSAGLSAKKRSAIVKKARSGKDIGTKGEKFKTVAKKAAAKYGSKESGEKVAAAAMWKNLAKESVEIYANFIKNESNYKK